MNKNFPLAVAAGLLAVVSVAPAQIGTRSPSEKKVVPDPVTGVPLTFLTSKQIGDSKIYQTHPQWTQDGKWVIFRTNRVKGQAFAVNEETGDIVQVTGSGFTGMLCVARKSMHLYVLRPGKGFSGAAPSPSPAASPADRPGPKREPVDVVEIDLAKLFADSEAGRMQPAEAYERVCGTIPVEIGGGGDLALDANEDFAYIHAGREAAGKILPAGTKIEGNFGARKMGGGPSGIAKMDLKTGEIKMVCAVPFQIGHIQSNPFVPGEIVFCWETGGKSPQRTWTVKTDGSAPRELYHEASYDWVTHEAVITKDEVVVALLGHRQPGAKDEWGDCGTREHPTGLGVMNLRTGQFYLAGQTKEGSGFWHVNGSPDGRWLVGDDFARNVYLIDRHTNEMMLLSTGHKETAADHTHPTFSADSTRIEIQSAMLSPDNRSMNICIVPVPEALLKRTYPAAPPVAKLKDQPQTAPLSTATPRP